eukprot:CAMPEP_0197487072 /NCGR_PEP_ID=MMETSP1311-20131121/2084_1 /TAXON_ID=464262 /ORGANISM="Genus nov. species nov., Strain RCC856" /LENGTH=39 /DNA_ID= /DNA_START= /DNA_END= /DNA_ORIENTATION=
MVEAFDPSLRHRQQQQPFGGKAAAAYYAMPSQAKALPQA